jgi:hypothetical protein
MEVVYMPGKKVISPADGAYGHFNPFGAVVIDRIIEEPMPEPEPEAPVPEYSLSELTGEAGGVGKSKAVVHLAEDYTIVEDHSGEQLSADCTGRLIAANKGGADRMYDLAVALRNTRGTSLPSMPFQGIELPPAMQAVMEYRIEGGQSVIDITERFTSHPEDAGAEEFVPNHLLVAGAETTVLFEIQVVNTSGHKVEELELRKEVPGDYGEFQLIRVQDGPTVLKGDDGLKKAQQQGSEILWKIDSLGAGASTTLRFTLSFTPMDVDPKPTGYIKASYTLRKNLSGVDLREFRALAKNIYSLRIEEVNEPGFWNCGLIFQNISEFPLILTRAYVARTDTDTVFLDIKDYPNMLQPDTTWESNSWQIKDVDRPKLTNLIQFRVIPEVLASSRVRVLKEGSHLTIASLAGLKSYDRSVIPSFTETDIRTTLVLANQGTGSLNELTIRDVIPSPMRPPEAREVKVLWNDRLLEETAYSLTFTPNDYDHLKNHTLSVTMVNLKDTLGTFDPGDRINVIYTARAIRPDPETTMRGPVELSGSGYPAGDRIVIQIPLEALPSINVEHSLRRYTIGKAVEPIAGPGEYTIELLFQNDGKTVLKDVTILDPVPQGFEVNKSEPAGAEHASIPEPALLWKFPKLDPGKRMTFRYHIRGTGEYHSADTQVSFGS